MDTSLGIDLPEGSGSRQGQAAELVRACLEQPETTAQALRLLLEADPGNTLATAAVAMAEAVSQLYASQQGGEAGLEKSLAEASAKLSGQSRPGDAATLMALAVRLGAEGDQVTELNSQLSAGVTAEMRQAMADGDDAAGERAADILKSLMPSNAEAWLVSGRMKLKQGLAEEARIDLERAVDLSPQSQNTLLNYARAQAASGQNQQAVLTLFKLLRIADGADGRYRPLAKAELEAVFNALAQTAARAQSGADNDHLMEAVSLMEEIADGVSGSVIEYVAGARNCVRAAVGYARAAQAVGKGRRGLAACEAAMEIEPDAPALWSTIARLRLHYNENTQAAQAFRQALELDGDQASLRDGLAEALFRDGQFDAALSEAESAVAAATGNRTIADRRDRIAEVKAASGAVRDDAGGLRHIAVLGLPYQGNAMLAHRIASATDGAFIGESVWLAGQVGSGGEAMKFSSCPTCRRPDCAMFDLEFRTALTGENTAWYLDIAKKSGKGLIVSSDNSAQIVRRHDPALVCDAVIAYRSPASAWAMLKKHYASQRRQLPPLLQFLGAWYRTYATALHEFPQQGKRVAVNLDEAQGDGASVLGIALTALELERSGDGASDQHFFGVNPAELTGEFDSSADRVDDLSASETSVIVAHADAEELYRKLQAL